MISDHLFSFPVEPSDDRKDDGTSPTVLLVETAPDASQPLQQTPAVAVQEEKQDDEEEMIDRVSVAMAQKTIQAAEMEAFFER